MRGVGSVLAAVVVAGCGARSGADLLDAERGPSGGGPSGLGQPGASAGRAGTNAGGGPGQPPGASGGRAGSNVGGAPTTQGRAGVAGVPDGEPEVLRLCRRYCACEAFHVGDPMRPEQCVRECAASWIPAPARCRREIRDAVQCMGDVRASDPMACNDPEGAWVSCADEIGRIDCG